MSELKPEEEARVLIDEKLATAGWAVVSRSEYSEKQNAQAVIEAITIGKKKSITFYSWMAKQSAYWKQNVQKII